MRKIGKLIWIVVRSILLLIIIGFVMTASTKNIQIVALLQEFKAQGVYDEDSSTSREKHYVMNSKGEEPGYTITRGQMYPGRPGDIIVTREAAVGGPITKSFITFMVGGHAAFCLDEYYDYRLDNRILPSNSTLLEATGLDLEYPNAMVASKGYWVDDYTYKEAIVLRVAADSEKRNELLSIMCSYLGDPYNYSFLFDTKNKSYCSDVISKGFKEAGYDLNKDGFITSIFDLIVSSDTHIVYYHYFSDGIKHIYYYE